MNIEALKKQLAALPARHIRRATAAEWGSGLLDGIPTEILPDIPENALKDVKRLADMCQPIAPRIMSYWSVGTIGSVNWGGDNKQLDALLEALDVDSVAEDILELSYYSGIMAGIVRRDPITGAISIEPLIGHVEPIYAGDSPSTVQGLIHAWTVTEQGTTTWTVRIYDLPARRLQEWTKLREPSVLVGQPPEADIGPSAEYPQGAPIPRFKITSRDPERMPVGDIAKLMPNIKADWSSQMRAARAEENTAFPQLAISGELEVGDVTRRGSHKIIRMAEGGKADFLAPGDLSELQKQQDRLLVRIRDDANLPGTFLGSGQAPSGEAMREANAKYTNKCNSDARALTRVMNELAEDFAAAHALNIVPALSVQINKEFSRDSEIQAIRDLFNDGLLEFGAAVRAISVYVPTWSDQDIEAFIEAELAYRSPLPRPEPGQDDPLPADPLPAPALGD